MTAPQHIGPYRLLDRIGRGGMGTVYLAEDAEGVRVAVKVINDELADESSFRDRFRREVTAARSVRRFCTASVLDANLEADPLYVVTEYVDGPNLDEHIRRAGPMRGSGLEHLAVGIATALTAIHGAGIVHRDLKPGNVLLSQFGPRVIDFGIARALDTMVAATRTGTFVGTPAYMAPEVIRGEEATPAADIWAWGCVVAFAGTGVTPFAAANVPAILYQVTQGEPNLEGLDASVRELVERALSHDVARRPSAQRLLELLTGQTSADPARIAPTIEAASWPSGPTVQDTPPPFAPPVQRAPVPQAPVGALAAAPPFGPGTPPPGPGTPPQAWASPMPPPTPSPTGTGGTAVRRPSRSQRRYLLVGAAAAVAAVVVGAFLVARGGGVPDALSRFDDAFSNKSTGWNSDILGYPRAYVQVGDEWVYQMKSAERDLTVQAKSPVEGLPDRALLSVDLKMAGSASATAGLFCFGQDPNQVDGYQFLVRADGEGAVVQRVHVTQGIREIAVRKDGVPGFAAKRANRVQIACEKRDAKSVRLRLWVNGDLVLDEVDANGAMVGGDGGLILQQGNWDAVGLTAQYDNFQIAEIRD
ncbi:serine/threonine protein kinase [Actinocorallia sp. API 0066]|uniref:serine/threonine-protein kinase n=1 Tax=Actinocorallia sp. API 0066 TaxID=2896846 RepID=UPI001E3C3C0B|nr:serine/threonine-protein kinase [Actinocorallia sp. API 0066]MCD0452772.1 serine/threonine protein kinase [Actinocorallia sp. API 0066]